MWVGWRYALCQAQPTQDQGKLPRPCRDPAILPLPPEVDRAPSDIY